MLQFYQSPRQEQIHVYMKTIMSHVGIDLLQVDQNPSMDVETIEWTQ